MSHRDTCPSLSSPTPLSPDRVSLCKPGRDLTASASPVLGSEVCTLAETPVLKRKERAETIVQEEPLPVILSDPSSILRTAKKQYF